VTVVTFVKPREGAGRGLTQRILVSTLEQSPERGGTAATQESLETAPVSKRDGRAYQRQSRPHGHEDSSTWVADAIRNEEWTAVAKGKRTFQPNNRRRARVHGFRLRMRTRAGRAIVSNRRGKGRRKLTA
jgi:large subunit ribosomal protein L34